jgi:hypothetical protein
MANLYITRCEFASNGQNITDFKGFVEGAITSTKAVPLMHKTGSAKLTRRFTFQLDYVVPQVAPVDWLDAAYAEGTGTAMITYDNGDTLQYGGVSVLESGEGTVDGENELVKRISFTAETRNGATE